MRYYIYLTLVIGVLFYRCRNYKKADTTITNDTLIDKYKFVSYNYCSQNLLFDYHVFGNTIIHITPNNNFLKCTAFNDSEFVFSCGSGKKEVVIFERDCSGLKGVLGFDGLTLPKLEFDDEEIMILYLKSGSDTWTNFFVYPSKEVVITEQALYIDYENRKYVYLDCQDFKNTNPFFIVHDIMSDTRDTLKSNYYKFRKDGYPTLNISDVSMIHDTLFYSVRGNEGLIRDTIIK